MSWRDGTPPGSQDDRATARPRIPTARRPTCPKGHNGDVWLDGFYSRTEFHERRRHVCVPRLDPLTRKRPPFQADGSKPHNSSSRSHAGIPTRTTPWRHRLRGLRARPQSQRGAAGEASAGVRDPRGGQRTCRSRPGAEPAPGEPRGPRVGPATSDPIVGRSSSSPPTRSPIRPLAIHRASESWPRSTATASVLTLRCGTSMTSGITRRSTATPRHTRLGLPRFSRSPSAMAEGPRDWRKDPRRHSARVRRSCEGASTLTSNVPRQAPRCRVGGDGRRPRTPLARHRRRPSGGAGRSTNPPGPPATSTWSTVRQRNRQALRVVLSMPRLTGTSRSALGTNTRRGVTAPRASGPVTSHAPPGGSGLPLSNRRPYSSSVADPTPIARRSAVTTPPWATNAWEPCTIADATASSHTGQARARTSSWVSSGCISVRRSSTISAAEQALAAISAVRQARSRGLVQIRRTPP
jgi:hypothetical protein